jgi:hypothetical protein
MDDLRWIALVGLMSACGASAPPPKPVPVPAAEPAPRPIHKRGGAKLSAVVGRAGGTLQLDNGARLDIPAGALTDDVELTFADGTRTTDFANRDFERAVGPTLEIAPEIALAQPIRVSIPIGILPEGFDASHLTLGVEVATSLQRAVGGGSTQTRWDYAAASSASGRAQAELSRVNGLRVQFVVSKSE